MLLLPALFPGSLWQGDFSLTSREIKTASGGDISGFSAQDRMVMGLCRAIADVVLICTEN